MSTAAGDPSSDATKNASNASPVSKGKEKAPKEDTSMEMDEDDEGDDEDDEGDDDEDDDDDEEVEEDLTEIDPTAIKSRRTRGVKVDYTSPEALAKAGLKPDDNDDEDEEMH